MLHILKCPAGCWCVRANRGSGTIRQVSGTVRTLFRNSPKPSETVPKRRRAGTIVKCRFGLQSSKDRIGLETNVTILEARKRKDRHPLSNRPPATPMHIWRAQQCFYAWCWDGAGSRQATEQSGGNGDTEQGWPWCWCATSEGCCCPAGSEAEVCSAGSFASCGCAEDASCSDGIRFAASSNGIRFAASCSNGAAQP